MNRISIISVLLVSLASFATTGCFAEPTSSQDVAQQTADVTGNHGIDSPGANAARTAKAVAGAIETHPAGTKVGPQPDPWVGDDQGPQPDPWVPHAHLAPPGDPDPSNPTPSATAGGAGGSSSNNK